MAIFLYRLDKVKPIFRKQLFSIYDLQSIDQTFFLLFQAKNKTISFVSICATPASVPKKTYLSTKR